VQSIPCSRDVVSHLMSPNLLFVLDISAEHDRLILNCLWYIGYYVYHTNLTDTVLKGRSYVAGQHQAELSV
jgi:hypothetical protein